MGTADGPVTPSMTEWHHIRIRPAETPLGPERVKMGFERLHHLETTVEFLLVSDGERIDYFAGTPPAEVDKLERILRGCFPDDYEFTRADPELERHFDVPDEVTTVEFTGRGERRQDWQTRLTTVATEERETLGSLPLVPTAGSMAETTTPVVYQALLDRSLTGDPKQKCDSRGSNGTRTRSVSSFSGPSLPITTLSTKSENSIHHTSAVLTLSRPRTAGGRSPSTLGQPLSARMPTSYSRSSNWRSRQPAVTSTRSIRASKPANPLQRSSTASENALSRSRRSSIVWWSDSRSRVTADERSLLIQQRFQTSPFSPAPGWIPPVDAA